MIDSKNASIEEIQHALEDRNYISERGIAMSILLALKLSKPLLIEGPAGVGKTEIAKVMASVLNADLIRLQCYEGLDASHALYEWNYQRQLLQLKFEEHSSKTIEEKEKHIFSDHFLLKRPLLKAITSDEQSVLLLDEIDRADEEFESFLLELLSDWQISIPEIGTIKAHHIPFVVITSNRIRELSEALRRRCLYLWIDYPTLQKEIQIIRMKIPGIDETLAREITVFMHEIRQMDLDKKPGVAEALDWAAALSALHFNHLDASLIEDTLGIVLKDWQDQRVVKDALSDILEKTGVKIKEAF
jgi:MoxR-like ATPase